MMEAGYPDIECQLIFDAEHDHYQLLDVGWLGLKRIYNCFIHFGNFLTLTGLAHRTYACRIQTRRL
jgi:hypothetical protein